MSRHAISVFTSLLITALLIFIPFTLIQDAGLKENIMGGLLLGFPVVIIIFAIIYVLVSKKIGSSETNPIALKIQNYLRIREIKKMPWVCDDCESVNPHGSLKCKCGNTYDEIKHINNAANTAKILNRIKLCPSCKKEIPSFDNFCVHCGEHTPVVSEKDKREMKKASKWILAISIMFVFFGTISGFANKSNSEKALNNLNQYQDNQLVDKKIYGNQYTVGELKQLIKKEVKLVFITNYFLAGIMFLLFLWSYKSPFPAMVTALCVYLATIALGAIVNPATLFQGIILKIIFISSLVAGIKSSLAYRKKPATGNTPATN